MKLGIAKSGGSVVVSVAMTPTDKPIFVHRINVTWFNASGNAFFSQSFRPDIFIEENIGISVLTIPIADGSKKVMAEACYEVVDGVAKTAKLSL